MFIKTIRLFQFKKYSEKKVDFHSTYTIIYGPNASGKTTILEAIYLLGMTKTFRKCQDKELINYNYEMFNLLGDVEYKNGSKQLSISYNKRGKKLFINKTLCPKASLFLKELPVVLF